MTTKRIEGLKRRELLWGAAALGLAGCGSPAPRTVAAARPARVLGIDMHNHVYPAHTEPHPPSPPGGGPRHDEPAEPALSLGDALRGSGLTAVCASFVLDFADNRAPGDARDHLLAWLDAIDTALAESRVRRATTLADVRAAYDADDAVLIQSVEGAHFIEGELGRIEEVYARGLRHLQLLHQEDDRVAPLGDTNTAVAHLGGLTPFGAEVVRECNRLGIVVDLAHADHATVLGALSVATRPLVVSHTSLDSWTGSNARMAEMMRPRLISAEHARVVADAGGVVGVWTKMAQTPGEAVASIAAMVDAIGVDHVGIGSDTDLLSSRAGQSTAHAWATQTEGLLPTLVSEMERQGWSPDDIAKVGGGNYARVLAAVAV